MRKNFFGAVLFGMMLTPLSGCMSVSATGLAGHSLTTDASESSLDEIRRTEQLLQKKVAHFSAFVRDSGLAQETGMEILQRLFKGTGPSTHYWQKISGVAQSEQFQLLLNDIAQATALLSEVNLVGKKHSIAAVQAGQNTAIDPYIEESTVPETKFELERVVIGAKQARRSLDIPIRKLGLINAQTERLLEQIFQFEAEIEKAHRLLRSRQFS